jgi:hypothetical protein
MFHGDELEVTVPIWEAPGDLAGETRLARPQRSQARRGFRIKTDLSRATIMLE